MWCANPFAFRPGPVTFWTVSVYVALLVPLLYMHETVPAAPPTPNKLPSEYRGVNITEGWLDLLTITGAYHPFNSRKNDETRLWLLARIKEILRDNQADYTIDLSGGVVWPDVWDSSVNHNDPDDDEAAVDRLHGLRTRRSSGPAVTVFDDLISNVTAVFKPKLFSASADQTKRRQGAYFEADNIIVYIRGTHDSDGEWWTRPVKSYDQGGVLVSAHFDSVATAYGASDNGIGVITLLQLLRWFTMPGHQPKKGVVLLLNNNEEAGFWGARGFGYSPLLPFCHTFINLEGAGAGGRAMLFRSTDLQVTRAYADSPHPFGSVVAADAFAMNLIRSGTDYSVWHDDFGQRGLDIAFYTPRSLYHTREDDAQHASRDSLYHMLSAALSTTINMANDISGLYAGPRSDGDRRKAQNGRGTAGVWFDLFGSGFAVFGLRSVLFAWSLTLLVASPIALLLVTLILARRDKYYFFAPDILLHDHAVDKPVALGGWKGLLRFPVALIISSLLVIGSGLLLRKFNPLIIQSSGYAVWAMMLSLFYFTFWCIMKVANFVRPSALHRGFVHVWLFALGWALLVVATVFEDRFTIASGYLVAFLQSAIFISTLITLLDFFSLPAKHAFAEDAHDAHQIRDQMDAGSRPEPISVMSSGGSGGTAGGDDDDDDDDDGAETEPDEQTPLRSGEIGHSEGGVRTTFATTYRRSFAALMDDTHERPGKRHAFESEQNWSIHMSTTTWFLQFLFLVIMPVILFGQVGLFCVTAVSGTGVDGSSLLFPFMLAATFSICILLPITPFIHRVTHHVPVFMLVVFAATLSYNLVAFPFSANNPYRAFFQQVVDLDAGTSKVNIIGLEAFVRPIISEIPTAAGQDVECEMNEIRPELVSCVYDGANVLPNPAGDNVPLDDVVIMNGTRPELGVSRATLEIDGVNTKMCTLSFPRPITSFFVHGSAGKDSRFYSPPDDGIDAVWLLRRDWSTPWKVDIKWSDRDEGRSTQALASNDVAPNSVPKEVDMASLRGGDGELKTRGRGHDDATTAGFEVEVACMWDDLNDVKVIPAYIEASKFCPKWSLLTQFTIGIVKVQKKLVV